MDTTKQPKRSRARKHAGTVDGLQSKSRLPIRAQATKRVKRLEAVEPPETDESKMGQSPQAIRARRASTHDIPKQFLPYRFKPGHSGNPSGRAKGSISLTSKLRKLLAKPAYTDEPGGKTKGDLIVEMAIQAAAQGDSNFFKEIMNRIDGKVSDHVIIDSAKRMVEQEAADVSAAVVQVAFEIVDRYIGDQDTASAFVKELGDKLLARLEVPLQLEADLNNGDH